MFINTHYQKHVCKACTVVVTMNHALQTKSGTSQMLEAFRRNADDVLPQLRTQLIILSDPVIVYFHSLACASGWAKVMKMH